MRESCTYGSARGALSNERPYRYRRRDFITLLGGAAAAWPTAAQAQQAGKVWRIGWLGVVSRETLAPIYTAFQQGMRELGCVEGKDFVSELRSVEGNYERLPEIAAELVQLKVDVIVTGAMAAVLPLMRATSTIPIVMGYSTDPVGHGVVASLVRPGGNVTGLAGSSDDSSPKQLELLATIVPNVSRVGLLGNPSGPTYASVLKSAQDSAQSAGLSLVPVEVRSAQEIEDAFSSFARQRVPAVVVASDAIFFGQQQRIAELALKNRLATMFPLRDYVVAGGLMSYGENLADFLHRAASYVDKIIFKGAKPGDLPIEQPTRFHLVINRKTADALGITIPAQLYIFAEEVIE
jgi:putative ABC transport system substrate-binding protein